jgi:O-antigen chain-terminating methyltransferase
VRLIRGLPDQYRRIAVLEDRVAELQSGDLLVTQLQPRLIEAVAPQLAAERQHLVSEQARLVGGLESLTEHVSAADEAVRLHAQRHAEELAEQQRRDLLGSLTRMQVRLDALRAMIDAGGPAVARPDARPVASAPPIPADLYAALEERFRGSRELITERQRHYVELVVDLIDDEHPLVDLGPGRGEWLGLVREMGKRAYGVDSNPAFVQRATDDGLDVRLGDLVDHLVGVAPASLGAVTLFQVIEHLPLAALWKMMRSALAALRPGGVFLAETPNSLNLRVAASTFWLDPTHERPLHPEFVGFMLEEVGFTEISTIFSNRLAPELMFSADVSPAVTAALQRLADVTDGPGDYLIVAHAPS